MPKAPEAQARKEIDRLLAAAGWHIRAAKPVDMIAPRGNWFGAALRLLHGARIASANLGAYCRVVLIAYVDNA